MLVHGNCCSPLNSSCRCLHYYLCLLRGTVSCQHDCIWSCYSLLSSQNFKLKQKGIATVATGYPHTSDISNESLVLHIINSACLSVVDKCDVKYWLYNEDSGLSNIHDRRRSLVSRSQTTIFCSSSASTKDGLGTNGLFFGTAVRRKSRPCECDHAI